MSETTNLYTAKQVAKLFKLSEATIKRWTRNGKLNALMINDRGDLRYPESEIQAFVDKRLEEKKKA